MTFSDTSLQTFSLPMIPDLVTVLRLDLNHPLVSGNKLFKLRPWLELALDAQKSLISCGGAWSNHLHAMAYACGERDIPCYGLVRAFEPDSPTPTMLDCAQAGMRLLPVSREQYLGRHEADFAARTSGLAEADFIWVPEGGTGEDAVTACEAIAEMINACYRQNPVFNSVWLAVGSGGTLAGVARRLDADLKLFAVPVMVHWDDVRQRVESYLTDEQAGRIRWLDGAAYGGFGRMNKAYRDFFQDLDDSGEIPFDPVYTGKLAMRLQDYLLDHPGQGLKPLLLHSGGLQGRRSLPGFA